jgi:uncharacterized membrane protein YfcA
MELGWQIVLGTLIGFFGAAFGSVGGVGGGGIFVPMLTLIIGFDPKSSTAISKCENLTPSCVSFLLYACYEGNSSCSPYNLFPNFILFVMLLLSIHLWYLSCPVLVVVYCDSKVTFLLIWVLRYPKSCWCYPLLFAFYAKAGSCGGSRHMDLPFSQVVLQCLQS